MNTSHDLFDDSTMTFGEHLEVLRIHLWKAIIGLFICVMISLFFGAQLIAVVRSPIDKALADYGVTGAATNDVDFDFLAYMKGFFTKNENELVTTSETEEPRPDPDLDQIVVQMKRSDLQKLLGNQEWKTSSSSTTEPDIESNKELISVTLKAPEFAQLKRAVQEIDKPKTFNVQEAFMTYIKVSFVFGLVLASPWVFFQLWLFVAAGLYPHERKYVYIYLPLSVGLFVGGAIFCFYAVFPFVLKFLFGFNELLDVQPQIRLSEWISFAIILPVMFGISFQLPIVMLFLERISVFDLETYRSHRRMAIFVIAVLSMFLTPADPMSMLLMMIPLVLLYELGIWLCSLSVSPDTPFAEETA